MKEKFGRFSKLGFALALGITWGICCLVCGWFSVWGWGATCVKMMSSAYVGYETGFVGGIVGGIWGFIDGFIGGAIFAFLYNFFVSKRK